MNAWEIRFTDSECLYQQKALIDAPFAEAQETARNLYQCTKRMVSVHRPNEPYAYFWINGSGEVNRNKP